MPGAVPATGEQCDGDTPLPPRSLRSGGFMGKPDMRSRMCSETDQCQHRRTRRAQCGVQGGVIKSIQMEVSRRSSQGEALDSLSLKGTGVSELDEARREGLLVGDSAKQRERERALRLCTCKSLSCYEGSWGTRRSCPPALCAALCWLSDAMASIQPVEMQVRQQHGVKRGMASSLSRPPPPTSCHF